MDKEVLENANKPYDYSTSLEEGVRNSNYMKGVLITGSMGSGLNYQKHLNFLKIMNFLKTNYIIKENNYGITSR